MYLDRDERKEMDELSIKAYGRANTWRKMVKKGEFIAEDGHTSGGKVRPVKRWKPITVDDVRGRMEDIIKKNEEARLAAEAKKKEEELAKKQAETHSGSDIGNQPDEEKTKKKVETKEP